MNKIRDTIFSCLKVFWIHSTSRKSFYEWNRIIKRYNIVHIEIYICIQPLSEDPWECWWLCESWGSHFQRIRILRKREWIVELHRMVWVYAWEERLCIVFHTINYDVWKGIPIGELKTLPIFNFRSWIPKQAILRCQIGDAHSVFYGTKMINYTLGIFFF
jgi:hypothetical protein